MPWKQGVTKRCGKRLVVRAQRNFAQPPYRDESSGFFMSHADDASEQTRRELHHARVRSVNPQGTAADAGGPQLAKN